MKNHYFVKRVNLHWEVWCTYDGKDFFASTAKFWRYLSARRVALDLQRAFNDGCYGRKYLDMNRTPMNPERHYWVINRSERYGPYPNQKDAKKALTYVRQYRGNLRAFFVGEHEQAWGKYSDLPIGSLYPQAPAGTQSAEAV